MEAQAQVKSAGNAGRVPLLFWQEGDIYGRGELVLWNDGVYVALVDMASSAVMPDYSRREWMRLDEQAEASVKGGWQGRDASQGKPEDALHSRQGKDASPYKKEYVVGEIQDGEGEEDWVGIAGEVRVWRNGEAYCPYEVVVWQGRLWRARREGIEEGYYLEPDESNLWTLVGRVR